ncbi:hypothetical protein [Treponema phagedenis]|nr:hypothetical protein [Treponema phagedenis]NVP24880.1 hypothetical protein [Treponema phagedenis]QEJ98983.1 hypothetical protein FUT82_13955 [Treponema phagedenis]QEK00302.1 hypothetical protein FUT84_03345 [Treponema phagedenis]QEK04491.1 hypothetical protein FUT83_12255 [Treponema phagedenis]QEK07794.1 hypothetical protein FUT80_14450 [Treponema phagedenis]
MKTADGEEIINVKIAPALMAVPEEPLSLPPIEFSRKQKKNWDEEEIQELYETPTKEEMEDLHKENEKQIKELMEAVP